MKTITYKTLMERLAPERHALVDKLLDEGMMIILSDREDKLNTGFSYVYDGQIGTVFVDPVSYDLQVMSNYKSGAEHGAGAHYDQGKTTLATIKAAVHHVICKRNQEPPEFYESLDEHLYDRFRDSLICDPTNPFFKEQVVLVKDHMQWQWEQHIFMAETSLI